MTAEEIQNTKNYAVNLHKTIEIKSEDPKTYDNYINNIIENDLNKINLNKPINNKDPFFNVGQEDLVAFKRRK